MCRLFTPAVALAPIVVSATILIAAPPDRANTGRQGPPTSVGRGLRDRSPLPDRANTGLLGPPASVGRSPAGLDRRPVTPAASPRGIDPPTDRAPRGRDRAAQRGDLNRADRSRGRTPGERPDVPGNGGGLLGRFFGAPDPADTGVAGPSDAAGTTDVGALDVPQDMPPDVMPPTDRLRGRERFALTRADRLLAKRLADIDHLRDVAMRNGNLRLLEQADRLEELARHQFARRTAGFDIPDSDPPTDPTDPGVPTDPTVPGVPMDPTSPADPTDPFPIDPLDPVPTDPTPPTDPLEPVPGLNEPGEVILGDIEPVDEPLN